jgi:CRISP-associated protein Cas1
LQLVINTYGSYLKKKDDNFLVSVEDRKVEVSPRKVSSILISTAAAISTDAMYLAMQHNIEIVILDHVGNPFARVWHCKPGSTNKIRRLQLGLDKNSLGMELAKSWLLKKNEGRITLLKQLHKRREGLDHIFLPALNELEDGILQIKAIRGCTGECRDKLMGHEGKSGKLYFKTLGALLPDKYQFTKRSKHPAEDPFNAMLNYAYGVMYSRVETACIIAGLDPYIGILHTDNYNKLSLVYDIIEMFRPWVEEVVVHLFTGRKIKDEFFREVKNGILLDKEGKQLLILSINDMLDKTERYNRRNTKRCNIIQAECHSTANKILNEGKT